MIDDLGREVAVTGRAGRVVSLVPSHTEALASVDATAIVGATDYCIEPPELDVARVRGTKNPDIRAIAALRPDLVVANQEENRELDVRRLEALGCPVWVTRIDSVPEAVESLRRLFGALGWDCPAWVDIVAMEWADPGPERAVASTYIWRDPWIAVGAGTFADDVLRRLGIRNAVSEPRYPHVDPDAAAPLVVLTSEPYAFTADDGPEAFPGRDVRLVDGRLLEWYGPSLVGARAGLGEQIFGAGTLQGQ